MEFRLVDEKDKGRIKWLWGYCFEKHEPFYSWYFSTYYRSENTLGCYERNQLLACLQLIPYEIVFRGKELPVSYLIGLATFPEARNKKIVKQLLIASLEEMRKRKHFVSLLMPFKAGFYYPYQWEICYYHYRYTIGLHDLKRLGSIEGSFSWVGDEKGIKRLSSIYERFMIGKNGYVKRTYENWQHILHCHWDEQGYVYLLERGEQQPVGYILYLLRENTFIVRELAYIDFAAQKSLYQFMYKHRTQVEKLDWQSAVDDLTYCLLPEVKEGMELVGFMAGRIVDIVGILEQLSYPLDEADALVLQVEDNLAEWNNGVFLLALENGRMQVSRVTGRVPEVSCSIGAFSQLVFGVLSAERLAYLGKLQIKKGEKLRFLQKNFPTCLNYIDEYF